MHFDTPPAPEIGVVLPRHTGRVAAAFAVRAEARGFDRLVALGGGDGDPFATLGAIAGATTRIRLTAAAIAPRERGARFVSRAARTLDELSGGRFTLAVTHRSEGAPAGPSGYDALLSELRHGPAAAVELLIAGADRPTVERILRHADGIVLPAGAQPLDAATASIALSTRWHEHDRGGHPRVLAFADATTDLSTRVADFLGAGASTVVIVPRTGTLQELDEIARVLPARPRR